MPFPPAPEFGNKAKYPKSPQRSGSKRKQLTQRLRREPSRGKRNSSAEAVGSKPGPLSPPERTGTFKAESLRAFPKVDSPRPSKKERGPEIWPLPVTRSLPEQGPAVGNGQGEGHRRMPGREKSESGIGLEGAGLTTSPQAAAAGTDVKKPMGGTRALESCPMCQIPFGPTLSQSDVDGHLAKCLSESTEDVIW
ncbi:Fanconi anemia core complex-associated protein 20 [Ornithorhynchus anatinus]|uniref:Fanconi anemia core complex-associated protein 20 n=1 Tax=Ornithorhynchus anatinus TaxID=9258 RepID=UPI0019D46005|nr:Fanconi anemia core complex-associated protein 20 [Ornithorhynchus anatinus]